MTDLEERFAERALARISRAFLVLAAGGIVLAYTWGGWRWSVGFLLGAAVSAINFHWLKQIVSSLGSTRPTRTRVAVVAGLRYVLLGTGAYVILKYSSISISAALMGLFVSVAAVIVEILIELTYART